jgi:hypothetical protein
LLLRQGAQFRSHAVIRDRAWVIPKRRPLELHQHAGTLRGDTARHLYRVLRALACLGLFAETPEGRFEMTPLALPLQTNVPESLRALAIMWGETFWRPYCELLQSVRTGEVAFTHVR